MTNKLERFICVLAILTFLMQRGYSQDTAEKDRRIYLSGEVFDSFTKAAVPEAKATLMLEDSTVVDTATVMKHTTSTYGIGEVMHTRYIFCIRPESGRYIIKVEHPNYETTYAVYQAKRVGKKVNSVDGPKIYLKKTARAHHFEGGILGEVVVKATKVKMVWRGDTLVYNADAFNVPEGSMLDGLIKQLPGVELTEEGEIFVNGKKIDNLTLNGADFFKGKNKIMLENLPYYTVKNVEVYNKQSDADKFLGINSEARKEYTMDVVLKREYAIGGSANLEGGYGTDDRYKLKAFGLRYTDHTRAAIYGGLNNINESSTFDSEAKEKSRTDKSGDRRFRQAGALIGYKGKEGKLNDAATISAEWKNDQTETRQQRENYLIAGNSFGQSQTIGRTTPYNLEFDNKLDWTYSPKLYLSATAKLKYQHNRSESGHSAMTASNQLLTDSINKTTTLSWNNNDRLTASLYAWLSYKLNSGDALQFKAEADGSRSFRSRSFNQSSYIYYKTATTDNHNRYAETPTENYNYNIRIAYVWNLLEGNLQLTPNYTIAPSYEQNDSRQYRLDQLGSEWESDGEHPFRSLPSNNDSLLMALDLDNTNLQRTRRLSHIGGLDINYSQKVGDRWFLNVYTTMPLRHEKLYMDYNSAALTTSLVRRYTCFEPEIQTVFSTTDNKRMLVVMYQSHLSTPSVSQLINRPLTYDPLAIVLGNPDLQASISHDYSLNYTIRRDAIGQIIRLRLEGSAIRNAFAQGYTYDPVTGVKTYRPENITSGNWQTTATVSHSRVIGRKKFFRIENELRLMTAKNTDLAAVSGSNTTEKLRIMATETRWRPRLRYQKDRLTTILRVELLWRNMHRNITNDLLPDNIWQFSYGLYASYKLPSGFIIDTDIDMHSRRGYIDSQLNDNCLYWDGTLTKSLAKGRWVVKLRGYDLLGQVSNLSSRINAQGRTETWTNALRRYVMLTLSYRFTQKNQSH